MIIKIIPLFAPLLIYFFIKLGKAYISSKFKKNNQLLKNDKALILTDSNQVDRTLSIFGKDEKFAKKMPEF